MRSDRLNPYAFLFCAVSTACPVTLRSVSSNKKVGRFTNSEKVRGGGGVGWGGAHKVLWELEVTVWA
jgi:hypothetical protein